MSSSHEVWASCGYSAAILRASRKLAAFSAFVSAITLAVQGRTVWVATHRRRTLLAVAVAAKNVHRCFFRRKQCVRPWAARIFAETKAEKAANSGSPQDGSTGAGSGLTSYEDDDGEEMEAQTG